jgi:hypothetical protein
MTRESRMLIIIGGMAVVAVVVLGIMAKRYANMDPELKSVHDLGPATETTVPETSPEWVDPIEGFITVRSEIVTKLNEDPGLKRRMEQQLSGQAREAPSRAHFKLIIDTKMARNRGLTTAGIAEADYHRVREAFVAWQENAEGADPGLVEKFEANRDRLDPLYLGDLEVLDQHVAAPPDS